VLCIFALAIRLINTGKEATPFFIGKDPVAFQETIYYMLLEPYLTLFLTLAILLLATLISSGIGYLLLRAAGSSVP
jgi:hypothetical protein